jgi:hypothetical protein
MAERNPGASLKLDGHRSLSDRSHLPENIAQISGSSNPRTRVDLVRPTSEDNFTGSSDSAGRPKRIDLRGGSELRSGF